ncbi:MAG: 2-hydroxychromene-2-carboxylate isomerase [Bradyrhizobium sp.]
MAIDFYFDFASPYGFIAAMRMEASTSPVRWHPFLLGAIYKAVGQSPLEHPLKRDYVINVDAPRIARRIGLELKVPQGFPEHSLSPSRAFYWIEQQDAAAAIVFAKDVYREYWLQGRSTTDFEVVVDAAAAIGFEREAVLAGVQSRETKDRLAAENDAALQRRVFGSPFFIVDGEPFWGSDQIPFLNAEG